LAIDTHCYDKNGKELMLWVSKVVGTFVALKEIQPRKGCISVSMLRFHLPCFSVWISFAGKKIGHGHGLSRKLSRIG
jgi:hypothetical protein